MRITGIEPVLLLEIPFLNAGRGAGGYYRDRLPVHLGYVDTLPQGTSALIVTADLQGRETFDTSAGSPLRLLGEVLPRWLVEQVLCALTLPAGEIGVLLAGDFYTVPALDKRGGSGDVTSVWQAFADEFDWVVGVSGNHDLFGDAADRPRLASGMHFLDGDIVQLGDRRIAGLSGITGNPRRPWRRDEQAYLDALELLLCDAPEILLLHDGPGIAEHGLAGSHRIRHTLEQADPLLIVRGHAHWDVPLAELTNTTQVLNVDARVVVLLESPR
ncbi:metallophosphoesterase family protein [Aeoliella mucimassa]|uniref:Calcineurin-like phosphoesterase domain-containing protein n=1 Tax=Aeoliella mucimassa TaxID=2527972 RepID=A0A518AW14_9BACT|nr:metallophosphoesterase [Aeoliella mucimassa]QDU58914.1 hypothetical protein Pan181_51550 [Aeoliella mucimassa]